MTPERQRPLAGASSSSTFRLSENLKIRHWQRIGLERHRRSRRHFFAEAARNTLNARHEYSIVAGTGAGKTAMSAYIANNLFVEPVRPIEQATVWVPSAIVAERTVEVYRELFGIHLYLFDASKHAREEPLGYDGYVATYQGLIKNVRLHAALCAEKPTLAVLDEVHHLADGKSWGEAARHAFARARYILSLSGTPYRHDNRRFPFVVFEASEGDDGILRFKPDYEFTLGEAIKAGYCRDVLFHLFDGKVMIRRGNGQDDAVAVSFGEEVGDAIASDRLRGGVEYGSDIRRNVLRWALERIKADGRKVIIFLGGDARASVKATRDAKECLPAELESLGYSRDEMTIIVDSDPDAPRKMREFENSDRWILISVQMISEGADVPSLSAAIFLTNITTMQTTVQRIGRILRRRGDADPHRVAWAFFLGDERFIRLETEIRTAIRHEIDLSAIGRTDAKGGGGGGAVHRSEVVGIGGNFMGVASHGDFYSSQVIEETRQWLQRGHYPSTTSDCLAILEAEKLAESRRSSTSRH